MTSPRWLTLMGDRPPGRPRYFELVGPEGSVAVTTGYLIEDPRCYESFNVFDLLWRRPTVFPDQPPRGDGPANPDDWFPSFVIVQPGYDATVTGHTDPDEKQTESILTEIARWAQAEGAKTVAVLYASGAHVLAALTAAPGWHRIRATGRAVLDVPAGGFDAYLASLPKSHRANIRADLRHLDENGVHTEMVPAGLVGEAELRLRMNLVEKYGGYSCARVERERLTRLREVYPDENLRLFRSRSGDGHLLGFSLFIQYRDQLTILWCGFDYDDPASRLTYFDCMFYAPLRVAHDLGVKQIDYGLGYEWSKKARGCVFHPRDLWVTAVDSDLGQWVERAAVRDWGTDDD